MSATPPPPPQQPYGGAAPQLSPADEKLWATLVHVGGILFNWIPALIGYLVLKDRGPFVRAHTATALNFQITLFIAYVVGWILSIVGIGLTAAQVYVSSVGALVTLSLIGAALGGLVGPAQMVGTMSLVPAPLRPHVGAVTALFGLGGLAVGTILLGGLTSSVGLGTAVIIASLPAAVGAVVTMRAGHHIKRDLDRTVEETIETYPGNYYEPDAEMGAAS